MKHLSLFFLVTILASSAMAEERSRDEEIREHYESLHRSKYSLLPHRETYIKPFVYNNRPHEALYDTLKTSNTEGKGDYYKRSEAEFQISFAIPVIRELNNRDWDVLFAYTHHSWWQIYNGGWSRPFRETNYNPEMFSRYIFRTPKEIFGLSLKVLDTGYMHESNGQSQILSRSWDRFFARVILSADELNILLTGWYRLREKRDVDDNVDIYNFRGLGDIEIYKRFNQHTLYFKAPLFAHYDSYDFRYYHPLAEGLKWFLNYQTGYGQSLIEYDKRTERYGIGIVLDNFIN